MAEKFGIKKGQYIFMFHTGSGLLGQYASYLYTPKKKEHFSQRIVLELGKLFWRSEKKNIYKKTCEKNQQNIKDKDELFRLR